MVSGYPLHLLIQCSGFLEVSMGEGSVFREFLEALKETNALLRVTIILLREQRRMEETMSLNIDERGYQTCTRHL